MKVLSPVGASVLLLSASVLRADVEVRVETGRVDVKASTAPLSEILDRLAKQTGMKVVYEGPQPRQSVTLSLARPTQAEAVLSVLEGQGLNYGLRLDPTGTRVETLLMAGPVSASSSPTAGPNRFAPPPASRPQFEPTPAAEESEETIAPPDLPPEAAGVPSDRPPGTAGSDVPGATPPGAVMGAPPPVTLPAAFGAINPFAPPVAPPAPGGQPTVVPGVPGVVPLQLPGILGQAPVFVPAPSPSPRQP